MLYNKKCRGKNLKQLLAGVNISPDSNPTRKRGRPQGVAPYLTYLAFPLQ